MGTFPRWEKGNSIRKFCCLWKWYVRSFNPWVSKQCPPNNETHDKEVSPWGVRYIEHLTFMRLKCQGMPFSLEIGPGWVLFFSPFQAIIVLNSGTHVLRIHPRGPCCPSHPDLSVPPSARLLISLKVLEVLGPRPCSRSHRGESPVPAGHSTEERAGLSSEGSCSRIPKGKHCTVSAELTENLIFNN